MRKNYNDQENAHARRGREISDDIHRKARGRDATLNEQEDAPQVGIFWLLEDGRIIRDGVPLSEAEPWGDYKNYPAGHARLWQQFERVGFLPGEVAYDEPPRGRVVYDTRTGRFTLYADLHILRNEAALSTIRNDFHLSADLPLKSDRHYRCLTCLAGKGL